MDIKNLLGYLSVLTALIGYGLYLRSIWLGKTRPHAFSWLLWALLTGIVFVAQVLKVGGAGAWVTGVSSVICLLIGISALFKDERGFSKFDWVFLSAALAALFVWFFTKNVTASVVLVTIIDVLGYASTIRKGYRYPHEEMATSFSLNSLKYVFALFALQAYSIATVLYPASLIFMNGLVAVLVVVRRRYTLAGS